MKSPVKFLTSFALLAFFILSGCRKHKNGVTEYYKPETGVYWCDYGLYGPNDLPEKTPYFDGTKFLVRWPNESAASLGYRKKAENGFGYSGYVVRDGGKSAGKNGYYSNYPDLGFDPCLIGTWVKPDCNGNKEGKVIFKANGNIEIYGNDCNNTCILGDPSIKDYAYWFTRNNVLYIEEYSTYICGVSQPTDPRYSQSYTCNGTTFVIGGQTYTKK